MNRCCDENTPLDKWQDHLAIVDLFLRKGASNRLGRELDTAPMSDSVLLLSFQWRNSDDWIAGLAVTVKLLHIGRPSSKVANDTLLCICKNRYPISHRLLTDYLHRRPFCCDFCEAITAKNGAPLKLCTCLKIAYCSRECQLSAWREGHKSACGLANTASTVGPWAPAPKIKKQKDHRKKNNAKK